MSGELWTEERGRVRRGVVEEMLAMSEILSSSNEIVESADGWRYGLINERIAEIVRSRVLEQGRKMEMEKSRSVNY